METETFLPALAELLRQGEQVTLPVSGSSMTPFLAPGRDRVLLQAPVFPLKRGDIALFKRDHGGYILHRVCKADRGVYYFVGDAQKTPEGPIGEAQICAAAVKVCRKGKWLGPDSLLWRFFAAVWLFLRPLRPGLIRAYCGLKGLLKGGVSHV